MKSILLVEDDPNLLENTSFELNMRGYQVTEATTGQEALSIMQNCDRLPDIIVSDIAMPDMDGYRFLERIRADSNWQGIPVLFVTAFSSKNSIQISKELGVDDYIVKPFLMDELIVAIENKLKRIKAFQVEAHKSLDIARRHLLDMISHELRTPVSQVFGGSSMLAEQLADSSDDLVSNLLEIINNGSQRLNRLINNALVLIQIDSGYLNKAYTQSSHTYSIQEIVMAAKSNIEVDTQFPKRQVHLSIIEQDSDLSVIGIYDYLVIMVEEILRNAIAFSPENGQVTIKIVRNNAFVDTIVKDNGPGIAPEDSEKIWRRFTQVNRDRYEQQGTGLGLAIVKEVSHIHHGYCKIVSSDKGGTVVTLSLPLQSIE